jgi:hypothetical protein
VKLYTKAGHSPGSGYVRPYGPNAPWNVPVAGLAQHASSSMYSSRLWNIGSNSVGNFNLRFTDFTYPVYETTGVATTRIVNVSSDGNMHNQSLPFNPSWTPAPGSDAQMIVLNPATGEEYNFFAVTSITSTHVNCARCNRITVNENNTGGAASYFTKENGFIPSRGVGIQYLAMLVRPEEMTGGINHAMSMPVKNTQCNISFPPATKIENSSQCIASNGLVEGSRFALNITEANITTWLNAMPADMSQSMKDRLRIIGRACRDYGWFITDTSGSAGLQFEANVSAQSKWEAMGMGSYVSSNGKTYPQDALDGLITEARIYMLVTSDQY